MKEEYGYPEEQKSLIIMDTFKRQDNPTLEALCESNHCEIVIVPHNLTNKFQPLDLTVNKPAKSFMRNKFNTWFSEEVAKQLRKGKSPADVKVSLKLLDIKDLHAGWIEETYRYLKDHPEFILKGFDLAGISEAYDQAHSIVQKVDNPFRA